MSMPCIEMHESHTGRWIALAVLGLVLATLLFPVVDGLSAAGFFGDKTYLIILQDNSEMRGTGGIIALVGVVTIHNGHITDLRYYYSHTSNELQADVYLDGPESFTTFFNVDVALLRDSNNQYDFASFAPKVPVSYTHLRAHETDS